MRSGPSRRTPRTLQGPPRTGNLLDRGMLWRVFGVLGPAETAVAMAAFTAVLLAGGWSWGHPPAAGVLAAASGATFAAVVLGQLATAFACRSESRRIGRTGWRGNPLLLGAVLAELCLLAAFLGLPPVANLLGQAVPTALGWAVAVCAVPAVWLAGTVHKRLCRGRASPQLERPPRAEACAGRDFRLSLRAGDGGRTG